MRLRYADDTGLHAKIVRLRYANDTGLHGKIDDVLEVTPEKTRDIIPLRFITIGE